jgi:transposase-like protein
VGGDHRDFAAVGDDARDAAPLGPPSAGRCWSTVGGSTESAREIRELKRKCRELEQTIEVLKAATSFFARECDPLYR